MRSVVRSVGIAGIAMVAPGIENWTQGKEILLQGNRNGKRKGLNKDAVLAPLKPDLLSVNERRRTTTTIKLALQVAQDATSAYAGNISDDMSSVFACSSGDLDIVDKILTALTLPGKPVSPTHFHNSVHNAPAGYWSIAAKSQAATTSIAAAEATFSAGLLEAVTQVQAEAHPVLLVTYDAVPPDTLKPHKPIEAAFAMAMLLIPEETEYTFSLCIENEGQDNDVMAEKGVEFLRQTNPAAQSLPLLEKLARRESSAIILPYLYGQSLRLDLNCHD